MSASDRELAPDTLEDAEENPRYKEVNSRLQEDVREVADRSVRGVYRSETGLVAAYDVSGDLHVTGVDCGEQLGDENLW